MSDELNKALGSELEKNKPKENRKRTNHLFAIGIDEYLHQPKLNNCKRDCERLIEILTSKYDFLPENVFELYNDQATFDSILRKLEDYAISLNNNDNLFVYFSGHGYLNKITDLGYWVPVEAKKEKLSEYIPNGLIRDSIKAINAHHIFLILDSCFSGQLFSQFKTTAQAYDRMEVDPSRWALTAGRAEVVSEGKLGDHSPFAKSIIGFLERNETALSTAMLCVKVVEAVGSNSEQLPRGEPLQGVGHQGGQFIFRRKGVMIPAMTDQPEALEQLSKGTGEETEKTPQEKVDASADLSIIQKLELKGLIAEAEIWTEKLTSLRQSHATLAEGAHKFELKMNIRDTEKELARVVEKIKAVTG